MDNDENSVLEETLAGFEYISRLNLFVLISGRGNPTGFPTLGPRRIIWFGVGRTFTTHHYSSTTGVYSVQSPPTQTNQPILSRSKTSPF